MFNKLLGENGIPFQQRAEFFMHLKENDMEKSAMHPAGAAAGALIGGAYAAHQASQRHTPMGPGMESPYSNKIRHEMANHLETRMNKENPSRMDQMKERLIAGKLRYARLAENDPYKAMALEAALGAGTGAIGGSQIGTALAGSKTVQLMKASSALRAADVCGVSRAVLEKKASHLQIPIHKAAELEVLAATLSKKAQVEGLTDQESQFMNHMRETQNRVTGNRGNLITHVGRSKVAMDALRREKRASLGALLMKREVEQEAQRVQGDNVMPEAMAPTPEPEDYRAPVRQERRAALSDLFGGPAGQQ